MSEWVNVKDRLPESKDENILVYFPEYDSVDMVHIQDYFDDITAGFDEGGKQLYTKWYLSVGITHWMEIPESPSEYMKG